MTHPPDELTAQRALALAFNIVKIPCSAAEAQRAEVLLGIAREIREAAAEGKLRAAGLMPASSGRVPRFRARLEV